MSAARGGFASRWAAALEAFLESQDDASLAAAYPLGREAMTFGLGMVEFAHVHAEAVRASRVGDLRAAPRFFAEALGPAEFALRGYRDAAAQLRELTQQLEARVERGGQQLVEAEVRYRGLIEQLPVVTYSAPGPADRSMTFVSPQLEGLTGYSTAEWLARPGRWAGRVHPEDQARVEAELAEAQRSGGAFRSEYRLLRKDNSVAWIRDEARVIAGGEDRAQQGIWLDVTERRMLEEGLRQTQKLDAVGRLAAGVSHDFNNILTVILSFSRFVADDLGPEHPCHGDLQEVVSAAERGSAITRQLLAFCRQNAFSPGPVDVGEMASGMERMLNSLLGERVALRLRPQPMLHAVHADPSQVEQILLNLVVNAGDAITGQGTVTIETSNTVLDEHFRGQLGARPGPYVLVAVSDTGSGMDEATQARIFEPFFTTKEKGKGTGLGLPTVYGIVRQLGGDLLVYSAVGRGTTFKVYLPQSFEEARSSSVERNEVEPRGDELILLAEDDPAVREVAARALRRAGFTVIEAAEPSDAAEQAELHREKLNLLVTDVILGKSTGPELLAKVRRVLPELPVLYMSGYTEGALESHGLVSSPDSFIEKPFTPLVFVQKVRRILDARRRG